MSVITNTGPLIALAKIDQLSLLEQMFSKVLISPVIHQELLAKTGPETVQLDKALNHFIEVTPISDLSPEVEMATLRLDRGEQQAVALAYQLNELLIIDDRLGRNAARRLNLSITGTAGVLLQAKNFGLISAVSPLLNQVRDKGYWLSDELLNLITKLAEE